jgi:hypothetical protein
MYQRKITISGKEIIITGSRQSINHIDSTISAPLHVTQCTTSAGGYSMMQLFGNAWAWEMFPGKKEEYAKELAEYVGKLPTAINARTKNLPSTAWYQKYIPMEETIKAMREEAKKAA